MTHETKSRCRKSGALTLMRNLFKLTPTCFTVLARLLDLDLNDSGDFVICATTIAVETGAGLDAVYDALIRLEDEKLIRRPLRPYKDYRGRYRPGKIKHTVFTPLFYQTIDWAEKTDCRSEDEFERLALDIKNSGRLAQAIEAQEDPEPDSREIPDRHPGNSQLDGREFPDRVIGKSPTEKSKENSIETKMREGEGFSSKSPEDLVIHRHENSRSHAQPQSDPAAAKIWQEALRELELQLPETTFETWVRDTQAERIEKGELVISVPHAYALDWLQSRLANKVARMLPDGLKPRFIIRGTQEQSQSPARDQPRPTADTPKEPNHDQGPGKLCACGETIPPNKADKRDECKQCWERKHEPKEQRQPNKPIWTPDPRTHQVPNQTRKDPSPFVLARAAHIDYRQASMRNREGPPAEPP
ncbi:MAG: hypothetical protein OXF86_11925 [Caldilineaceae bacterium]|nr:hypothetical protein [Caldilineaceae bacterium]